MSRGWEFEPDSYRPFYEEAQLIEINTVHTPPLYEDNSYNNLMRCLKIVHGKAVKMAPELADTHLWLVVSADSFREPDGT